MMEVIRVVRESVHSLRRRDDELEIDARRRIRNVERGRDACDFIAHVLDYCFYFECCVLGLARSVVRSV